MPTSILRPSRRGVLAGLGFVALSGQRAFAMGPGVTRPPGFYVPDEALRHERTFMQWPVSREVHLERDFLAYLQETIAEIANSIVDFEPVVMLMAPEHERAARRLLSGAVEIWPIPTEDLWARDSGPLFVVDGQGDLAIRQMNFNGWGGKQVHIHDGQIAARVADRMGLQLLDNGLVGEPGGVETDGEATLIAHESSWVNPNRNGQSKEEIGALLKEAYGGLELIWAPGIAGEDITDYHIDSLARFVEPGEVIIQLPAEYDPDDLWNGAAHQTFDILAGASDAAGRRLNLTVITEPQRVRVRSDDFVASYVNYYVCNGAVIAAEFGDRETDEEARRVLANAYPNREIVLLNVDALGEIGGGIHCATREQPAV
ncbi:agmatine deiminase family protein [Ahrensia marina]|uniref:agmatine deiminase family protein n=1 Tax=Ahrensia marina TaxID=1514904 RepID=UPI0035CED969